MTDPGAHFQTGAAGYAAFRPTYPGGLAAGLAALAPDRALAVDVGCGSGQLTGALAGHFDTVVGVDVSEAQLAHAAADPRIRYLVGSSDALPVPDGSAALVVAAQVAHWFDLPRFDAEARRAPPAPPESDEPLVGVVADEHAGGTVVLPQAGEHTKSEDEKVGGSSSEDQQDEDGEQDQAQEQQDHQDQDQQEHTG